MFLQKLTFLFYYIDTRLHVVWERTKYKLINKKIIVLKQKRSPKHFENIAGIIYLLYIIILENKIRGIYVYTYICCYLEIIFFIMKLKK